MKPFLLFALLSCALCAPAFAYRYSHVDTNQNGERKFIGIQPAGSSNSAAQGTRPNNSSPTPAANTPLTMDERNFALRNRIPIDAGDLVGSRKRIAQFKEYQLLTKGKRIEPPENSPSTVIWEYPNLSTSPFSFETARIRFQFRGESSPENLVLGFGSMRYDEMYYSAYNVFHGANAIRAFGTTLRALQARMTQWIGVAKQNKVENFVKEFPAELMPPPDDDLTLRAEFVVETTNGKQRFTIRLLNADSSLHTPFLTLDERGLASLIPLVDPDKAMKDISHHDSVDAIGDLFQ